MSTGTCCEADVEGLMSWVGEGWRFMEAPWRVEAISMVAEGWVWWVERVDGIEVGW